MTQTGGGRASDVRRGDSIVARHAEGREGHGHSVAGKEATHSRERSAAQPPPASPTCDLGASLPSLFGPAARFSLRPPHLNSVGRCPWCAPPPIPRSFHAACRRSEAQGNKGRTPSGGFCSVGGGGSTEDGLQSERSAYHADECVQIAQSSPVSAPDAGHILSTAPCAHAPTQPAQGQARRTV